MWELYDALIEAARREMSHAPAKGSTGEDKAAAINHSPTVTAARISPIWTTVRAALDALSEDAPAAGTIGLALTLDEPSGRHPTRCGNLAGTPLTELMADVKSWNFADASLGLAAINAVVNRPEAFPTTNDNPRVIVGERTGIFGGFEQLVHGRRVCLVGHAPFAERLAHICELTILERIPREGDLPDPACEYVLPSQDFAFITASALINKTMPRLLELSERATTVVWGPSSTLSPALLAAGVDAILGNVVTDAQAVERITGEGGLTRQFSTHLEPVALFASAALAERYRGAMANPLPVR